MIMNVQRRFVFHRDKYSGSEEENHCPSRGISLPITSHLLPASFYLIKEVKFSHFRKWWEVRCHVMDTDSTRPSRYTHTIENTPRWEWSLESGVKFWERYYTVILVLRGALERKKAMPYAQLQQYSILQRKEAPDGVLVGKALEGDQEAFESLVNRYHHQLVSYTWGILKDYDQMYDVLQQVYLQLYISLPILSREAPIKGWLFRVARNRCLDELRRRRRTAEVPFSILEGEDGEDGLSPLEAIADPSLSPEEVTESIEMHAALQVAIVSLPPKFRSILHLRCFRQLTFSEIGQALNMPESTVKTYFYRSLPRLRTALASNV
jgi:RNA polymerase sigma factor (sigma-70 family)